MNSTLSHKTEYTNTENDKNKLSLQAKGPKTQLDNKSFVKFGEELAILSHYLHNKNYKLTKEYREKAEKIFHNVYDIEENIIPNSVAEECFQYSMYRDFFDVPFLPTDKPLFTFIDLFAGIGGFRLAMQSIGGKCVFSSEWDTNAQRTYLHNFGEVPFGDITKSETKSYIPESFDILCAGFPCQAFSVAGYRKGFEDTRGTLFFDVAEIVKERSPKVVFLENVKNLYTHDNGKTFSIIKSTMEELGYYVFHKIMSPSEYANIPQNRERIFIVCFNKNKVPNYNNFVFPKKQSLIKSIHDCIDYSENNPKYIYNEKMSHYNELINSISSKDTIYQWRRKYVRENKSGLCPTLTANMGTGGHNVPLILTDNGIRKLSPKECLNFQGFPKEYSFPLIATSACYKQAGNSVTVPLITKVCEEIWKIISPHS